ncbi:MAG: hypothetical protein HC771_17510 [Synechococcales cyanobacterium CRU_2_2]|nr:hypothetical protein [Synechococcales cyanobacterium CRU_2_2]
MIEALIGLIGLGISLSMSVAKLIGAIDQRADKTDAAIASLQSEMGHQISEIRKNIALQDYRLQQIERRSEPRGIFGELKR